MGVFFDVFKITQNLFFLIAPFCNLVAFTKLKQTKETSHRSRPSGQALLLPHTALGCSLVLNSKPEGQDRKGPPERDPVLCKVL